jgi:hypothetical protein
MSKNIKISAPRKPDIEPAKPGQTQIIKHRRDIHTYTITDAEIDDLRSGYASPDFGLFTLSIGIFIGFVIALATTQMSDIVFATFIAITIAAYVGIIFFGIRTYQLMRRAKQRAQQIKGKSK